MRERVFYARMNARCMARAMQRQNGRLAQRERRSLTRTRSGVQIPHRPPRQAKGAVGCSDGPFFRSRTRTNGSRETSSVEVLSSRAALVANRDDTLPPGLRTVFASMLRFERVAGASILVTWENAAPGQPAACETPSGKAPTQHLGANCAKRRRSAVKPRLTFRRPAPHGILRLACARSG